MLAAQLIMQSQLSVPCEDSQSSRSGLQQAWQYVLRVAFRIVGLFVGNGFDM